MYVYACVHAICGECTYVHRSTWGQEDNCGCYSSETGHLTSCPETFPDLGLPDLAKLAGQKESTCLCLPNTGYISMCHHAWHLREDQTQVLTCVQFFWLRKKNSHVIQHCLQVPSSLSCVCTMGAEFENTSAITLP